MKASSRHGMARRRRDEKRRTESVETRQYAPALEPRCCFGGHSAKWSVPRCPSPWLSLLLLCVTPTCVRSLEFVPTREVPKFIFKVVA